MEKQKTEKEFIFSEDDAEFMSALLGGSVSAEEIRKTIKVSQDEERRNAEKHQPGEPDHEDGNVK